jgi:hypothetical protein
MTKAEAIQAMIDGNKVTHKYFSDKEYIFIDGEIFVDECGCRIEPYEFWYFRIEEYWETDWEIYKQ